jgi:hypothetical protein
MKYGPILLMLIAVPCWSQTNTTGKRRHQGALYDQTDFLYQGE